MVVKLILIVVLNNLFRIKSIGRTIGLNIEELKKQCNLDTVSALDHEKEMKLAKLLLR